MSYFMNLIRAIKDTDGAFVDTMITECSRVAAELERTSRLVRFSTAEFRKHVQPEPEEDRCAGCPLTS